MGKALIWSGRLFTFLNSRGGGQTRSVGGGGGGGGGGVVFENSLDSSIYVVCYVNVLHVLNDFNL